MKKKLKLFVFILIFSAGCLFSAGNRDAGQAVTPEELDLTLITDGEHVMKALYEAFNDKIERVEYRKNDWAVLMNGVWYYYAKGRLLPAKELRKAAKFRPYQFYKYPAELPPQTEASPEEIELYLSWTNETGSNILSRSVSFPGALWKASTRKETEKQIVEITFLGKKTSVHIGIQPKLAIIEEQIIEAAKTDKTIQKWIENLGSSGAYYWRVIAKTKSRSYHSYGLAIDLLPEKLGGKQTYWLWASQDREDWWNVPYSERYHPPEKVIKIFESYGFVWGGKWVQFDTMHFEYRPEVFILNGLPLTMSNEQ
jgi:hypothetical protein